MEENLQQNQQIVPPQKSKKWLVMLLVALGILVAGYFIAAKFQNWWLFQIKNEKVKSKNEICIQVITPARNTKTGEVRDFPTPCDVPEGWEKVEPETIDETANWQTYRNDEFGFEVKYPERLQTNFGGSADFAFSINNPDGGSMTIFIDPVMGLEGTKRIGSKVYDFGTQKVTADIFIDDPQYAPSNANSKYILAQANHKGRSFVIKSSFDLDDNQAEKLFDQILSTFRFTN